MDEKNPQNSLPFVKIHDSSGQKIVVVLVRGHLHYTIIILHYFVSLSLKKQSWALDNTITRLCFQVSKLLVITLLLYLSWLLYLDSDPLLRCRCREATKLSGAQLFKKTFKNVLLPQWLVQELMLHLLYSLKGHTQKKLDILKGFSVGFSRPPPTVNLT